MKVLALVQDAEFKIEVGSGQQHILWLAQQAKFRYARHHHIDPGSLVPTELSNADGELLLPGHTICDCIEDGDKVHVQLRGSFKEAETHSYSVWERHSIHEYANFVKILFVLDCRSFEDGVEEIDEHAIYDIQQAQAVKDEASVNMDAQALSRKHITRRKAAKEAEAVEEELEEEISSAVNFDAYVIGNFTNWKKRIQLEDNEKTGLFHIELMMPPSAEVLFRFEIEGRLVASKAHTIIRDANGTNLNIIQVPTVDSTWCCPQSRFQVLRNPKMNLLESGEDALEKYIKAQNICMQERRKMFMKTWNTMRVSKLVRNQDERRALKKTLWKHSGLLTKVFNVYSGSEFEDDKIDHMNNMEFWTLCQRCQIPSVSLNLSTITKRFYSIDENLDSKTELGDRSTPEDEFNLVEFYEGLVMLAMSKFNSDSAAEALDSLAHLHLAPFALSRTDPDGLRFVVAAEGVQKIFQDNIERLKHIYSDYRNKADFDIDVKQFERAQTTINFAEFKMFLKDFNIVVDGEDPEAVANVFASSQDKNSDTNPLTELVFSEFLEVLARIANARFREQLPLDTKLQRFFNEVLLKEAVA